MYVGTSTYCNVPLLCSGSGSGGIMVLEHWREKVGRRWNNASAGTREYYAVMNCAPDGP